MGSRFRERISEMEEVAFPTSAAAGRNVTLPAGITELSTD
jgi:hypothetical protein